MNSKQPQAAERRDKESKRSDFLSHLVANRSDQELHELGLSAKKAALKQGEKPAHYLLHAGDGTAPSGKEEPGAGLFEIPRDFSAIVQQRATPLSSTSSPSLFSGLGAMNTAASSAGHVHASTLDVFAHNGVPYVLLGQEGTKGKFLLKGSKVTASFVEEKHICNQYFVQYSHISFPYVVSLATLNEKSSLLNVYNVETTRNSSAILDKDLVFVALFATSASITILCTDTIVKFLDLENLKTKYSISIPGNPISETVKYKELGKKNLIFFETLANTKNSMGEIKQEVLSQVMDLSTGLILLSPKWKLRELSTELDLTGRTYCSFNNDVLRVYVAEHKLEYEVNNVAAFCLIPANEQSTEMLAVAAVDGTVTLYSTCLQLQAIYEIGNLVSSEKNLTILKMFYHQDDLICIHASCIAVWSLTAHANTQIIELADPPTDCHKVGPCVFLVVHPKLEDSAGQIKILLWTLKEATKKEDKERQKTRAKRSASTGAKKRPIVNLPPPRGDIPTKSDSFPELSPTSHSDRDEKEKLTPSLAEQLINRDKNFTKKQRKKVASTLQYERLIREARFKKIFKDENQYCDFIEFLFVRQLDIYLESLSHAEYGEADARDSLFQSLKLYLGYEKTEGQYEMMGIQLSQFQPFSAFGKKFIAKLFEIESRTLPASHGSGSHRARDGKDEELLDSQDWQCVTMELFLESRLFQFVVSELDSFYEIFVL